MIETLRKLSLNYLKINATFAIKSTDGRVSSFIIDGIFQEDLITEIKSIIHNYIQKSGQTLSSSYWSAQSVTTPLEGSTSGEKTKKEGSSGQRR